MIVRKFLIDDIKEASKISHLVWGDLYKCENFDLQKFIYDFTIEYYYLNKDFSFALDEKGLCGLLFASLKTDKNTVLNDYKNKLQSLNNNDKQKALNLIEYVENTGKEVKKVMSDNDFMLGLFISTQKGGGKMLDYYQKNNFTLVKQLDCTVNNQNINTLIFKKEIENIKE